MLPPAPARDHILHRLHVVRLDDKHPDPYAAVIDAFSDPSPPSSASSSDLDHPSPPPSPAYTAFAATRSRVVRLFNLPANPDGVLGRLFAPNDGGVQIPAPVSLWSFRADVTAGRCDSVWVVFRTHEEASAALLLASRAIAAAPALERELEPFARLQRVRLPPAPRASSPALAPPAAAIGAASGGRRDTNRDDVLDLRLPSASPSIRSLPPFDALPADLPQRARAYTPSAAMNTDYTLSTNPPNPKTSFRLGDWICPSPSCAAHNFGRNLACIGCGCPRTPNGQQQHQQQYHQQPLHSSQHQHQAANGQYKVNAGRQGQLDAQQQQYQHILNQQNQQPQSLYQTPSIQHLQQQQHQHARPAPSPRFAAAASAIVNGNPANLAAGAQQNGVYYSSAPVAALEAQRVAQQQHTQIPKHSHQSQQGHPCIGNNGGNFGQPSQREQQQSQQQPVQLNSNALGMGPPATSQHITQSRPVHTAPQVQGHSSGAAHVQVQLAAALTATAGRTSVQANKSAHPLLTPSGRDFAVGGRVQNISRDPLSPCIMYWPDNEAFPEPGQIRPSCMAGVAQPPILNTGNRGPISHQPGDWICQKCNYLNWRRRKVCQTCLPYAEGNGDSISAAVQAERIALLTTVLAQTQLGGPTSAAASPAFNAPSQIQATRSHSLTPPQTRRPFIDLEAQLPLHTSSQTQAAGHGQGLGHNLNVGPNQLARGVHRSQSHFALGQQYAAQQQQQQVHYTSATPIYQTSGHRQPSPLPSPPIYGTGLRQAAPQQQQQQQQQVKVNGGHLPQGVFGRAPGGPVQAPVPAPLLPAFLQDMVQSPALSPTSTTTTSSADLSSIEEYDEQGAHGSVRGHAMFPRARGDSGSSTSENILTSSPIANIWRLDGTESKTLSAFPLPNHQELVGARKTSREQLRA